MTGTETTVVIVGAGFGGIATAIELRRAGVHDFVVLERAAELGGVWRENTYPGAGCDVPSPLYSFSYARDHVWPRRYSGQAAIHDYLGRTARRFGVLPHIRFGRQVVAAAFDESSGLWAVRTACGEEYTTRVFVPATGQLSQPAWPDIPGQESFRGGAFHSAQWDHDCDLRGKRVAVIGTGASAIQFVPEIQPLVEHLTVFQRSAQYILPKRDHGYEAWPHKAFRKFPWLQTLDRLGFWLYAEFAQQALSAWPFITPLYERQTRKLLRDNVSDPELRRRLTPDYPLGCKRVLFSNDYLPAVSRSNVELVTEKIVEIVPEGVRTADGVVHEVDVLIYGTGFAARELLSTVDIRGVASRTLAETWRDGARAHLGISVPDFPNMFLVYGPNTNLGGGSVIYMLESQARYIRDAVRWLLANPRRSLDARAEAERRWDDEVQARLRRSVWTRCSSWYRSADGRVVSNWPGRTFEYRRRTRAVTPADYRVREHS